MCLKVYQNVIGASRQAKVHLKHFIAKFLLNWLKPRGRKMAILAFLDLWFSATLSKNFCELLMGHQQMYDLERFYGTKVGFYKGTDSYKSYKLVQTCYFSMFLMP